MSQTSFFNALPRRRGFEQRCKISTATSGFLPDVDGFAALVSWLGLPAERFFTGDDHEAEESVLGAISAYLRASKELPPEWAATIEAMVATAYEQALVHGALDSPRGPRSQSRRS